MKVKSQLLDAQLEQTSTTPTKKSQVIYDTSDDLIKYGDGSATKEVVEKDATQTLTNKTLAVTDNSITGTAGAVGVFDSSGNLASSSITTTDLANLDSISSNIQDQLDAKADQTDLDTTNTNVSTNTADIATNASNLSTHEADTTTHGTTGDIVGTTDTQTLSNKEFSDAITLDQIATPSDPASGKNKLYAKSDNRLYTLDSDGNEAPVGSGSGGGGALNFIDWGDFETATSLTKFTTFDDSGDYVDGTGGDPSTGTISVGSTTSTPLNGKQSIELERNGDISGMGWSADIDIPLGYRGVPIYVNGITKPSSGYVSSDLEIKFYDITNSAILAPVQTAKIISGTNKFTIAVIPPSTCTQLRYSLYCKTDNATGDWSVLLDDLVFTPQASVPGAIAQDLGEETWDDNWANTTTTVELSRFGNRLFADFIVALTGTPTNSGFTITIPSKYAPKSSYYADSKLFPAGPAFGLSGASGFGFQPLISSATAIDIHPVLVSGTYQQFVDNTTSIPGTWKSGDYINFSASWIVDGWDTGAMLSTNELAITPEKIRYTSTSGLTVGTSATLLKFETKSKDDFLSYDSATGLYTVRKNASYRVCAAVKLAATSLAAGQAVALYVYKNGSLYSSVALTFGNGSSLPYAACGGDTLEDLAVGDTISIYAISDVASTLSTTAGDNYFTIEEVPNFSSFSVYGPPILPSDTTANRPSSPSTGQMFFDTTLGQPIWYDGTGWVDATGTTA